MTTPLVVTASVRHGARAPEALRLTIRNSEDDTEPLNLSTVTGAVPITATPSTGSSKTWNAAIESQSASVLVVVYTWAANGSDIPKAGVRYELMVDMTTPGGVRRAGPMFLQVT